MKLTVPGVAVLPALKIDALETLFTTRASLAALLCTCNTVPAPEAEIVALLVRFGVVMVTPAPPVMAAVLLMEPVEPELNCACWLALITPALVMVPAAVESDKLTLPVLDMSVLLLVTLVAAVSVRLAPEVMLPPVAKLPVLSVALNVLVAAAVVLKLPTLKLPELAMMLTLPEAVPEFGSWTSPVIEP